MATLKAGTLDLANYVDSEIWSKSINAGVLSQLTPTAPELKVGATDIFTFTGTPKAELVGESGEKSSADEKPVKVTTGTYKVQVTYRYSQEVQLLGEEGKIQVVDALVGRILTALSRSLDLIAIHGINPKTGEVSPLVTSYLDKAGFASAVELDAQTPNVALSQAVGTLISNGYQPTGLALDPHFTYRLSQVTDSQKRPLYPELQFGLNMDSFQGLTARSSDTVSGKNDIKTPATAKDLAIVADWNTFRWGIAKEMGVKTIEYGDPDGSGDLQRTNEIAIRGETYLGFAFLDPKAYVVVKSK